MKKQKWVSFAVALAMMGAVAALLGHLGTRQKLGEPAVTNSPIPGSIRLHVNLPERVLDYASVPVDVAKYVLDFLPPDTSFGQRRYTASDGFVTDVNVVLMGTDRTSLHKPEICLEGQGWHVIATQSGTDEVHIERPCAYDLQVMKLIATKEGMEDGQPVQLRGIYVYWFVAPGELTAHHWQRMWWMGRDLLFSGVLQRWAYVSFFHVCRAGQEEACLERMKKMMAAAVPEFQLTPAPANASALARAPL